MRPFVLFALVLLAGTAVTTVPEAPSSAKKSEATSVAKNGKIVFRRFLDLQGGFARSRIRRLAHDDQNVAPQLDASPDAPSAPFGLSTSGRRQLDIDRAVQRRLPASWKRLTSRVKASS
jgi:hypothetical protein